MEQTPAWYLLAKIPRLDRLMSTSRRLVEEWAAAMIATARTAFRFTLPTPQTCPSKRSKWNIRCAWRSIRWSWTPEGLGAGGEDLDCAASFGRWDMSVSFLAPASDFAEGLPAFSVAKPEKPGPSYFSVPMVPWRICRGSGRA